MSHMSEPKGEIFMKSLLKDKVVLVTGGTGSIGETIVKYSLTNGAKLVKVFSNDENGLYEMEKKISQNKKLEFYMGDIRDEEMVDIIVKKTDLIFHAAAVKHVDRCELNPSTAIAVNITGTKNVIKAALRENVKKVISISTDKAVNPVGVMGATKLLGEKLISAESFRDKSNTVLASVRFGNVLHSRGSLLPLIESQIQRGGPVTLTDERMKRFFMTKEEAVNLIMQAAPIAKGGETFVLKMQLLQLKDLFEVMKEILAPKYGFKPSQIKTKIIGMTPGEKLTEFLLTNFEMEHVLETKEFFIIPPLLESIKKNVYPNARKPRNIQSYFQNTKPINKKQILDMLKKAYSAEEKLLQ